MPVIDTISATPIERFPKTVDAVVIGAGVIGISAALELVERGLSVAVVEKGEVACEQSSRNWGWVRQMGRDPRELPLIRVSMGLWRGMDKRVGADVGFRTCGIAYLAADDAEMAQHVAWHGENVAPHGLSTRVVSAAEAARLVPGGRQHWVGALYTPDDGRAEPFVAVPAMARAVQAKGGLVFTRCAARGLEVAGGRVVSVVTELGRINTSRVVLAGGYWSRRFLGNLGVRLPQLGIVNSVMRTTPVDAGHETTFSGAKFATRKRLDGGYTVTHNHLSVAELTPAHAQEFFAFLPLLRIAHDGVRIRLGQRFIQESRLASRWALDAVSPFEQVRVLDPTPYPDILDEAAASLGQAFPAFAGLQPAERWAGMIDATPDAVPVIDHVPGHAGLLVATGFSGHGFGLGPGGGKLAVELLLGETPCVDAAPFRYQRLVDGTRAKPTTGL